jgi:hypothetical protein
MILLNINWKNELFQVLKKIEHDIFDQKQGLKQKKIMIII